MTTSRSLRCGVFAVPLLTVLLLAGCSSSGSSTATTSSTAGASSGSGSATTAASSSSTVSQSCPTAAAVSAALGSTYPSPKSSSSDGTVTCNYSDPSTSANLVIVIAEVPGLNATALKASADGSASVYQTTASPVSGFGDAAYIIAANDASNNASGIATTAMYIEVGSTLVDITAQATPAQVKSLAGVILNK